MFRSLYRSAEVPEPDRLARLREFAASQQSPMAVMAQGAGGFQRAEPASQ